MPQVIEIEVLGIDKQSADIFAAMFHAFMVAAGVEMYDQDDKDLYDIHVTTVPFSRDENPETYVYVKGLDIEKARNYMAEKLPLTPYRFKVFFED